MLSIRNSFEKLLITESNNTLIQLFRYTFVGGTAFLADIICLAFCTEVLGLHYLTSAAIGFGIGILVNYILSNLWVFNQRKVKSKSIELIIFTGIGIIGLGFNELFIWWLTEKLECYYLYSKIVAAAIVYLWNFFARKFILY